MTEIIIIIGQVQLLREKKGSIKFDRPHTGGNAQSVAVLSADVLRNENSVGCQRPDITLSWCWATTTLGNGIVKSPEKKKKKKFQNKYFLGFKSYDKIVLSSYFFCTITEYSSTIRTQNNNF